MFIFREYRSYRASSNLVYTRSVKKRDIVDAARNALSALTDAELQEQDYALTGETVYSEAYAGDVRTWGDESAALGLVARNDPAKALVDDFSKAGAQAMSELALVVSLYDNKGREAALDRIRKSSGIVYLDQARSRVVEGAGVLFFLLTVANTLLLAPEIRRKH